MAVIFAPYSHWLIDIRSVDWLCMPAVSTDTEVDPLVVCKPTLWNSYHAAVLPSAISNRTNSIFQIHCCHFYGVILRLMNEVFQAQTPGMYHAKTVQRQHHWGYFYMVYDQVKFINPVRCWLLCSVAVSVIKFEF